MVFYRGDFTQLWLVLTSDEPLGVLDTDYLEDFYGADGFISLRHVDSDTRFQMAMLPVGSGNIMFRGVYNPNSLPDGFFEIEGRVRDLVGNYTILTRVQNPLGHERIIPLGFEIRPGRGVSLFVGALVVEGGFEGSLTWANLPQAILGVSGAASVGHLTVVH